MQAIINFWKNSYKTDKTAFYLELCSAIGAISASTLMAITAPNPDFTIVYPLYLLGSATQVVASYRRNAAWVMLICVWFTLVNILGFFNTIV